MKTIATLDPTQIAFGVRKAGVKNTEAFYVPVLDDGRPVSVQLTTSESEALRVPFALSTFDEGDKKRSLALECTDELKTFASALDARVMRAALDNSKEWFGRKLKETEVETMYMPLVHESAEHAPFIRTKLSAARPTPTVLYAGTDFASVSAEDVLVPNARILPIAKLSEVWFMPDKFGVTFTITQAVVWPPPLPALGNFVGLTLPE